VAGLIVKPISELANLSGKIKHSPFRDTDLFFIRTRGELRGDPARQELKMLSRGDLHAPELANSARQLPRVLAREPRRIREHHPRARALINSLERAV
jgi:hypothetical protein